MSEWQEAYLSDIADIRVSNVDKKSKPGEAPVRLCNYMDVYSNDYIRADIEFMESTANPAENERFKVETGDVLITKDSETPYDIGIPAVVIDQIDDLVCGYHLALIKPKGDAFDSIYLAKQLGAPHTASYFSRMAAGSTRYGLSNGAIGRTKVRFPSLTAQKTISRVLYTIDLTIEKTEALIEKYQQIKAGLMHDLFARGIGADGKLRPPREQARELYQETPIGWIPKEWQYELLDKLAQRVSGHTPNKNIPSYWNGGVKWVSLADSNKLDRLYVYDTMLEISQLGIQNSSATLHPTGTVVMTRDAGVGKSAILAESMAVSQHFMAWICREKIDNHFLYHWLQHNKRTFENVAMGSTIVTIGLPFFKKLRLAAPVSIEEQREIGKRLTMADEQVFALETELAKSRELKSGLMHDLLTGKVPVKADSSEAAHV